MVVARVWETGGTGNCCLMCADEKSSRDQLHSNVNVLNTPELYTQAWFKWSVLGQFPSGPVVRIPCFHCWECRLDPWVGNWKKKDGKFYVLCILSELKVKKKIFLNISLLPFFLQATPVNFQAHHSAKTALVKVPSDLHTARSQGQSQGWTDWPVCSICCVWSPSHLWPSFPTWLLWHAHSISSKRIQKGTLPVSLLDCWNGLLSSLTFPLLPLPSTSLLNPAASVIPLTHARLRHSSGSIPKFMPTSFTVKIHMQKRPWDSPAPPHIKSLIASPTSFPWSPRDTAGPTSLYHPSHMSPRGLQSQCLHLKMSTRCHLSVRSTLNVWF